MTDDHRDQNADQNAGKQVSEVGAMDPDVGPQPISPEDATAGYPDSESGSPNEGEAGPNAAPKHDSPRPGASPGSSGTEQG